MIRQTMEYLKANIENMIKAKKKLTFYCVHELTEVNYGIDCDIDLDYCKEHNIKTYFMPRRGGCIVSAKGGVSVIHFRPTSEKRIGKDFAEKLVAYLKNKGLNAVYDKNDIMVSGYKTASVVDTKLDMDKEQLLTAIQISINQDMEAIKNVCKKHMEKIPKGLGDFGITTNEMILFCHNYFKNA